MLYLYTPFTITISFFTGPGCWHGAKRTPSRSEKQNYINAELCLTNCRSHTDPAGLVPIHQIQAPRVHLTSVGTPPSPTLPRRRTPRLPRWLLPFHRYYMLAHETVFPANAATVVLHFVPVRLRATASAPDPAPVPPSVPPTSLMPATLAATAIRGIRIAASSPARM